MSLSHPPMATGRTAEIYDWNDHQVLKLFYAWAPRSSVHYEAQIARAICAAGLPVPQVGELVEIEGRLGLEYQKLSGPAMGQMLLVRPWTILRAARQLAELHVTIHAVRGVKNIPSQHERLRYKIEAAQGLPEQLKTAALTALAGMPTGQQLCHGDFHPWNVLMTDAGAIVIDWVDATCGSPPADVARTAVLIEGSRQSSNNIGEKLAAGWFWRAYVRHYFDLRPGGQDEYRRWWPLVAAGRMSEDIPEQAAWLQDQVEIGLRTYFGLKGAL